MAVNSSDKQHTKSSPALASKRPWYTRTRGLIVAAALSIYVVTIFFVSREMIGVIYGGLDHIGLTGSIRESVLVTLVAIAVFSLMLGILVLIERLIKRKPISFRKLVKFDRLLTYRDIGIGLLGLVPAFILAAMFAAVAVMLFPSININEAQQTGFENIIHGYEYSLAFFTLVVLAPIVEEMIFRGYLYTKIRRYAGPVVTILFVSLTFAALHQPLAAAISVFGLAIVIGIVREYTGSIWPGIILHAAKNGIAYYFLFIAPGLLQ